MWVFRRADLSVVPQESCWSHSTSKNHVSLVSKPNLRLLFFFPQKSWLAESYLGDIFVLYWEAAWPPDKSLYCEDTKSGAVISVGALSLPAHGVSLGQESSAATAVVWRGLKSFALYLARDGMGWEEGRSCVGHIQHRHSMETVTGIKRNLTSTCCSQGLQRFCPLKNPFPNLLSLQFEPKTKKKVRERHLQCSLQKSIRLRGMTQEKRAKL